MGKGSTTGFLFFFLLASAAGFLFQIQYSIESPQLETLNIPMKIIIEDYFENHQIETLNIPIKIIIEDSFESHQIEISI